jgi:rare lipoprotein A (peptidoglycan hydrolase)
MARVTNLATGASVDCFVNDFIEHPERDIDLSSYAFKQIADLKIGLVKVKIEQL